MKKVAQEAKVLIIQRINSKLLINIRLLWGEAVLDRYCSQQGYPELNLKRWPVGKSK